ncbi:MAG: hypothetical protein ABGX87_01500 [Alcanivorax sp.]|uniref:hypothetical protein n=1 Tax=Alloalcanivorax marinus TaxID=1177169 RepID=UPI00195D4AFB|nr:hypothetical protein [Alloalcanivorax marinus]MBM7333088.1 hypothetical protein [Alloalcanivorax marinus]
MPRFRVFVYALLCLTSLHVLVADVGVHEHRLSHAGDAVLSVGADHALAHADAGGERLSQPSHCCQCHGFVSPLAVLPAPPAPAPTLTNTPAPPLPPAPAFGPYRPPIASLTV